MKYARKPTMKPYWILLLSVILLISGCAKTSVPGDSDTVSKPLPDTGESQTEGQTSTREDSTALPPISDPDGTGGPSIVETVFPTDDIVIADYIVTADSYGADPGGEKDSSAAIQKALNDCAKAGGGTVYLPAGRYRLEKGLKIPSFVTLHGDWCPPDHASYPDGTMILACQPSGTDKPALFDIGGSAGVVGLTVFYPEQRLDGIKEYPYTFYTNGIGDHYMLASVRNVTVVNGYRGIGACCFESNPHEMLTVENFYGTFLSHGAQVYNQADVGTWKNINIGNGYWLTAGEKFNAPSREKLEAYTVKNATGLILGDLEWTEFTGLNISDCAAGIRIVKGKRIEFAGSLAGVSIRNCTVGVCAEVMDDRWGMLIADSEIEGTKESIRNDSAGVIKLSGVTLKGETAGSGQILSDGRQASGLVPHFSSGYTKPEAKLYVAALKTGMLSDVSEGLQKILDEAGKTGGVVYLPAGTYSLSNPVAVPAGVELRGASSVPTRDQSGKSLGTVILCRYGVGKGYNVSTPALITLSGKNAGISGIRIVCVTNSPADRKSTGYLIRGEAEGVYCVNCSLVASDYGVDFRACDKAYVKKLVACCYKESITMGGEGGVIEGCLQNGNVLCRCSSKGLTKWVTEDKIFEIVFPITRSECTFIRLENAHDTVIYNTFAYGVRHLIETDRASGISIVNVGADNLGGALLTVNGGSVSAVNVMRWNGSSYVNNGGKLCLLNRITINEKYEENIEG